MSKDDSFHATEILSAPNFLLAVKSANDKQLMRAIDALFHSPTLGERQSRLHVLLSEVTSRSDRKANQRNFWVAIAAIAISSAISLAQFLLALSRCGA